jgi:hypothetical protein
MLFYLFAFRMLKPQLSFAQGVSLTLGLNAVTHPVVYLLIMNLHLIYIQKIIIAEVFAFGVEAILIRRNIGVSPWCSLGVGSMANFLSWQIGPMLTYAFLSHF